MLAHTKTTQQTLRAMTRLLQRDDLSSHLKTWDADRLARFVTFYNALRALPVWEDSREVRALRTLTRRILHRLIVVRAEELPCDRCATCQARAADVSLASGPHGLVVCATCEHVTVR